MPTIQFLMLDDDTDIWWDRHIMWQTYNVTDIQCDRHTMDQTTEADIRIHASNALTAQDNAIKHHMWGPIHQIHYLLSLISSIYSTHSIFSILNDHSCNIVY